MYRKTFFNRLYVIANVDSRRYLVHDGTPAMRRKSANTIARLVAMKDRLCRFLERSPKYSRMAPVRRLLRNRDVEIEEKSFEYRDQAAYSINKGERIGMCLKSSDGRYEDINTMFFVLMHELAHIMSKRYAHDGEFWNNFSTLIQAAVEAKIYRYQHFDRDHTTFCGHSITYTPYKK